MSFLESSILYMQAMFATYRGEDWSLDRNIDKCKDIGHLKDHQENR